MRATLSLLLLLAACADTKDVTETDVVAETDPELDTEVDTETETDPPGDTDTGEEPVETDSTGALLDQPGVTACPDATTRETSIFDRRELLYDGAPRIYLEGAGSALADFTGDGLPDVVAVTHGEILLVRQTNAGAWESSSILSEPNVTDFTGMFGATVIDIDDDNDFDLFVTARGLPNHLLINDGTGGFTDGTEAAGLTDPPEHHSTGSTWFDWDVDGDLDLLVAGHGWVDEEGLVADFDPADPTLMYVNQGDGTFQRNDALLPDAAHRGYTFVGGWLDADDDGDDDLYFCNDFGVRQTPGNIIWNDNGVFVHDSEVTGLMANLDSNVACMGLALGDLDGDGLEDIGLPAWNNNLLFMRRAGIWFESSQSMGWVPDHARTVGWGAEFVDADSDGELDLTTAYGFLDTIFGGDNWENQPDGMWVQREGTLYEMSRFGGFDDAASHRSINTADLNRDGWPDFVKIGMEGKGLLYMSNCGEESWATVKLQQPAPNRHAVGAIVRIFSGDKQYMRRVRAGGTGYGSGTSPQLIFGLGDIRVADRVVVEWTDGRSDTFVDVPMEQHLTITRP